MSRHTYITWVVLYLQQVTHIATMYIVDSCDWYQDAVKRSSYVSEVGQIAKQCSPIARSMVKVFIQSCTHAHFHCGQGCYDLQSRVKDTNLVRSNDQGRYLVVKNLDPPPPFVMTRMLIAPFNTHVHVTTGSVRYDFCILPCSHWLQKKLSVRERRSWVSFI